MRQLRRGASAALLLIMPAVALAEETAPSDARSGVQQTMGGGPSDQDLARLSLEELAMVEVTSVSRRPEALADAAAAVFVISAEDIRRSGATSLPEVLRLAPNLNVQRVNASDYAISARGFNGYETSNKLLVLVDGRSIYSTLHSGVFWDAYSLTLQNIERIEVISGPGGALYGANAMNGVINIITRSAADTQGTLISVGAGSDDATYAIRHGGNLGGAGAWRAYLSGHVRGESQSLTGLGANDDAEGTRAGARADWAVGENRLTLLADVFDNQVTVNEDLLGTETHVRGGNVLGRWTRPLAGGELQVQAYFDHFERDEPGSLEESDTWDLSVQHAMDFGRHQLVLGAGHRVIDSRFTTAPGGAFLSPPERTLTLTNLFVQDQVALREGLTLTLGAKFEDNSFSGQEFLPNVRLAWQRPGGDLLWGAVSRASRTPNRIERDLILPGFLEPGDFRSERLTAYELGYRANPTPRMSFSINAFYNVYDDLRTVSITPATIFPLMFSNHGEATTWGVETWGSYDISPAWRLSAGISTLTKDYDASTPDDISGLVSIGDDPDYQMLLRSQHELTDAVELDVRLRAVGDLATVDSYVEADMRLGWRLTDQLELSLTGRNLIEDRRVETGDPVRARAFGRSVFGALQVRF
ncbi:MAG: TonB-dependent receptor [Brevundimonas sp.]|uniref:TonB-dependent receptor plug domain-containing protein n=1 Tax=Brevundimonas sp. TaxID=1871086 RepID=UPI0026143118|nr:TonB-dependent receptor [Brevundimonas sp.]MDI6624928.1 TonB-dependent receptor [Brevundimonas sp.]MDQ7811425.1 TonB-dependent receptor [Brevundimonas sp.]